MLTTRTILVLALGQLVWTPVLINSLNNGLALTPPMGWLSWARFTCTTDCETYPNDCINSQLYMDMAERLIADGYAAKGYQYVNIDDCWSEHERDPGNESLVPDRARFPAGMSDLANFMHERKLKLGIYGDCGTATCAGYPAQLKSEQTELLDDNYFTVDANQLTQWKVDSFKFDGCNLEPSKAESICPKMSQALAAYDWPVLVVCEWPFYMLREANKRRGMLEANKHGQLTAASPELEPDYELAQRACNAWRYYEDIEDSWLSVLSVIDFTTRMQDTIVKYHGPGHWFDPDQLVVGNFALSLDEARAQMAIWSVWSAPLYMSNDLRQIEPEMGAVLMNEKLIAVDQDKMGVFGLLVNESSDGRHQAFAKPVEPIKNGCPSFVLVYLNRDTLGNSRTISFQLRNMLKKLPIELAAERYAQVYHHLDEAAKGDKQQPVTPPRTGEFSAAKCSLLLDVAMTKEVGSAVPLNKPLNEAPNETPIDEKQVLFSVEDLFNDEKFTKALPLDGELELRVNPSGVRAVKLTQI